MMWFKYNGGIGIGLIFSFQKGEIGQKKAMTGPNIV